MNQYFKRAEFACKCGCGADTVDAELLRIVTDVREYFEESVIIRSGMRCPRHNGEIGGSRHSQHLLGKAADITVENVHADVVADYLQQTYPEQYGIGRYNGRTHIDVRLTPARWDNRITHG